MHPTNKQMRHGPLHWLRSIRCQRHWLLLIVAVILGVLVVLTTDSPGHESLAEDRWFLPEFRQQTSDLDKLVIWSSQGKLVLEKLGNQWRLPAKDNYPADLRTVVDFILPLREMKILEKKTAQPELLSLLGLDEQQATHVVLLDRDATGKDRLLGDFVMGQASRHGHGGFVRHARDTQAWLVNKRVIAPVNAMQWIDRLLLELPPRRLQGLDVNRQGALLASLPLDSSATEVTMKSASGETKSAVVTRSPQDPKPVAIKADGPEHWRNAVSTTLNQLVFDDVKARPDGPIMPWLTSRIHSTDGLIYQLQHFWQDGQWWTALQVQPALQHPESPQAAAAYSAEQLRRLQAMNQRWQNWWFHLPSSSLQSLTLGLTNRFTPAADGKRQTADHEFTPHSKDTEKNHEPPQ